MAVEQGFLHIERHLRQQAAQEALQFAQLIQEGNHEEAAMRLANAQEKYQQAQLVSPMLERVKQELFETFGGDVPYPDGFLPVVTTASLTEPTSPFAEPQPVIENISTDFAVADQIAKAMESTEATDQLVTLIERRTENVETTEVTILSVPSDEDVISEEVSGQEEAVVESIPQPHFEIFTPPGVEAPVAPVEESKGVVQPEPTAIELFTGQVTEVRGNQFTEAVKLLAQAHERDITVKEIAQNVFGKVDGITLSRAKRMISRARNEVFGPLDIMLRPTSGSGENEAYRLLQSDEVLQVDIPQEATQIHQEESMEKQEAEGTKISLPGGHEFVIKGENEIKMWQMLLPTLESGVPIDSTKLQAELWPDETDPDKLRFRLANQLKTMRGRLQESTFDIVNKTTPRDRLKRKPAAYIIENQEQTIEAVPSPMPKIEPIYQKTPTGGLRYRTVSPGEAARLTRGKEEKKPVETPRVQETKEPEAPSMRFRRVTVTETPVVKRLQVQPVREGPVIKQTESPAQPIEERQTTELPKKTERRKTQEIGERQERFLDAIYAVNSEGTDFLYTPGDAHVKAHEDLFAELQGQKRVARMSIYKAPSQVNKSLDAIFVKLDRAIRNPESMDNLPYTKAVWERIQAQPHLQGKDLQTLRQLADREIPLEIAEVPSHIQTLPDIDVIFAEQPEAKSSAVEAEPRVSPVLSEIQAYLLATMMSESSGEELREIGLDLDLDERVDIAMTADKFKPQEDTDIDEIAEIDTLKEILVSYLDDKESLINGNQDNLLAQQLLNLLNKTDYSFDTVTNLITSYLQRGK
jgi:hypothetical protein